MFRSGTQDLVRWPLLVHRPVVEKKKIEEFLGTYSYRAGCRSVGIPCLWLACDWLQHLDIYTLFNDDTWLCLLVNDFLASCQNVNSNSCLENLLSDTLRFKRFRIFRASLLLSPGTCGEKRPRQSNLIHPSKRLSGDKTGYLYIVINCQIILLGS